MSSGTIHPTFPGEGNQIFAGGGEMGKLFREHDWSATVLGAAANWSQSLCTALSICLASHFPMLIWWGTDLVMLYNDAYRQLIDDKHPASFGQAGSECWPEIWDIIGPMLAGVLEHGTSTWSENQLLYLKRKGYAEECYFTFSYSPIRDETGQVVGVFTAVTETTGEVLGVRRLRLLQALTAATVEVHTLDRVCFESARVLASDPDDIPFSLLYQLTSDGQSAVLEGDGGLLAEGLPRFNRLAVTGQDACRWFSEVMSTGEVVFLETLAPFAEHAGVALEALPASTALILPLVLPTQQGQLYGFLVAGISEHRQLDDDYRGFLRMIATQIATSCASARAYQDEQERADALAELDRAKTVFFSNISHEFRTPLALSLSPLENVLSDTAHPLTEDQHLNLEMVYRNQLRQLKLVNTLLDFSRIEAGRVEAIYLPTDLARQTRDLVSAFHSAIVEAGLELVVDCQSLSEQIYVDRDMWEKIVLNLLSNALKFTMQGTIRVSLRLCETWAELSVQDTGTGISAEDLPHLFERFYRVQRVKARTQEGSGIGLSLVQELIKLHNGTITVHSTQDVGSTFIVNIPRGSAHLPQERLGIERIDTENAPGSDLYVEEALSWLPRRDGTTPRTQAPYREREVPVGRPGSEAVVYRPKVLIVDDNRDMRDYLARLLAIAYEVRLAVDGNDALEHLRQWVPELIISDVMMPERDGIELLKLVRSDPVTSKIPFLLLSARAGEGAVLEGLHNGADDYLTKPFSARELLARVQSRLEITQLYRRISSADNHVTATIEAIADGVLVFKQDGSVSFMNEGLRAFLKLDPAVDYAHLSLKERAELMALRDIHGRLLPEEEWPHWRLLRGETLTGSDAVDLTIRVDGQDRQISLTGAPILDATGQVCEAICVLRDITERHQSQLAVEQARQHLYDLLQQAPAVICMFRGPQHVYELANPLYLQMIGQRDIVGKTIREALPELEGQGIYELLDRVYQTGEAFVGNEVPVMLDRVGSGELEEVFFNFIYQAFHSSHGDVEGILVHAVDVTEQVQARQRMDVFLGIASHELKNPLTSIKGNIQLSKRQLQRIVNGLPDDVVGLEKRLNDVRGMLDRAERQIDFQNRLIGDLVDTTRIQAEKLELRVQPTELWRIIRQAVEEQRTLHPQRVIELDLPPVDQLILSIDGDRIGQVVTNYMTNALKYSEVEKPIAVQIALTASQVRIAVTDQGPGLSPLHQRQIWERFYRVPEVKVQSGSGVGLGLGLHICRTIIEHHRGQVGVESQVGVGSTFWFTLPLVAGV